MSTKALSQKPNALSAKAAAAILQAHKNKLERAANIPPIARLQLHPGQQHVVDTAKRFNVLACGRRWGKTELGQDLTVEPLSGGWPVGWFSPTYKDLLEVWDHLTNAFKDVIRRANKTERRIEINTGGVLECWTLEDQDAGRGRKYKRVIVDEAAKARLLKPTWEQAIRPTLTDYQGDAWFKSTPKGRNYYWQLWTLGQDPLNPDWMSWQMPTSANPYINPSELEAARRDLPQVVYEQEYLAEFTESAMLFRNVRECVASMPTEPISGHRYVIGADWAQRVDFTVFVVVDATTRQVVHVDRSNQIDYYIQRDRLAALMQRWNVSTALVEENSIGVPNIEELHRGGIAVEPFHTSNESKAEIVQALMGAFERREIAIPQHAVLISELEAYEATRLPSGKWRYSAPDGMHDDTVIALALAWWAAQGHGIIRGAKNPFYG